ncbi:LLM class flavin-dependent oxidoreductase [Amycolatopsis balhimycina DSM 5908]|uniref:LLM class flavin-dependent oxidoreductase n=1 Tax=Amycolatopsis balhimycina DSM 5908 TaxID=1081091 RepID=A0A428WCA7_AMYBA|nr:LLM class flavin-dependent oxidoreductase [Amycolatopsis balhimycina]RSM40730.1 LLM class flavin-dependent oxidoreductase [Amycolatopsis balhimycina DSM 5908]
MPQKAFRFGVVAGATEGGAKWLATARRAEELGYSTLLCPDSLDLPTPTAALAAAAAATTELRVGSFVLASPLRTARAAAWEAHSLTVVTEGRFELGLGTGRPEMRQQAEELGLPYGSGQERLDSISETVDHVRRLDGDAHTPVMIAAGGPKARHLAGLKADIVTLAGGVLTTREEMAEYVGEIRAAAGDRDLELAMNIWVIGDEIPPWIRGFLGVDAETLVEHDSLGILRGDIDAMAEELERRREELGISYVSVNSAFIEQFAPLVERLTGK